MPQRAHRCGRACWIGPRGQMAASVVHNFRRGRRSKLFKCSQTFSCLGQPVDYRAVGKKADTIKRLGSLEEIVMIRKIADFRGEQILVTDRPSCPYCNSRRQVAGPVGTAITIEARRVDGSRSEGRPAEVWTCVCPTLRRPLFFGVLLYEVEEQTITGLEHVDLAASADKPGEASQWLATVEATNKAAQQ